MTSSFSSFRYFNSHPHEEDDHDFNGNVRYTLVFQLTSSRRGWQDLFRITITLNTFQLTSSRRGWHSGLWVQHRKLNFNSHPHEEDDITMDTYRYNMFISTHILTKRMTIGGSKLGQRIDISTHILTKRMTWCWGGRCNGADHFNSHPHEEDDPCSGIKCRLQDHFNSHPHEEDDYLLKQGRDSDILFQLTSSRRGWQIKAVFNRMFGVFQLTSSRRGWPFISHPFFSSSNHFNSHPHEEDD